ncbi:MAG: fibronectin type III domain-containing protein [Bacteroidia bacterium]
MHCSANEPVAVFTLSNRLINSGLYFNTGTFGTPVVPLIVLGNPNAGFQFQVTKLGTLISQAKGNSLLIGARDAQAVLVHGLLEQLLLYVNQTANHDLNIISESGFDNRADSSKHTIPPTPVIKKVSSDKQPADTYKVFKAQKKGATGPLNTKAAKTHSSGEKFNAQITLTPDVATSWVTVVENMSSKKLLITLGMGLTPGKKNWVRIYAHNAAGKSDYSAPFPFTPAIP